jgi:hypothetical protein
MNRQLDDLLGDVREDELVLNDEYMRQLEHTGMIAAKQRREASLSSVKISDGVMRAGLRAIKQATASELQKVTSKKRNLDAKRKEIEEKADDDVKPSKEATSSLVSSSLLTTSASSLSMEDLDLTREYADLQLRIRGLDPSDILSFVLSKQQLDCSNVSLLASSTPEGAASKKRPREAQLLEPSPELDLILSNKLYLQWEKSLVRWVKASAFKNLKGDIQTDEASASTNTSTVNAVVVTNDLVDESAPHEDEINTEVIDEGKQSPAEISKPSNRQRKREERDRMKRVKMHIHGRGAGYGRGLSNAGEPKFEDLHPSWRLQKVQRARTSKLISVSLKKKGSTQVVDIGNEK